MGLLLARDLKVLYLSLEDCSGFARLTGEEYKKGLSDLLLLLPGRMDFLLADLLPLSIPGEIWIMLHRFSIRKIWHLCLHREITGLIKQMVKESTYGTIILDLGQMGKRAADVLEICDVNLHAC